MKFSVLLPTRNRLDLLSKAIETVCRQDYDDWEIIVSDNFSEEDVSGYIDLLGDSRIKYLRTNSFIPVTENWNNALNCSNGDYIIMLGDDDCLMRGYFSTLSRLIVEFDSPDFIYTSAFLYAYPNVIPDLPDGFLRTYNKRRIFQAENKPFWLERNKAIEFVEDSLNFRVTFDYNMQFSLVSRKLVNEIKQYGQFYQSPYPDYYASNAIMLKANRILIVPKPLVTIGISPKSFGFYYVNDAESDGNEFLNNIADSYILNRVQKVILPGITMNTTWLLSMETLYVNFNKEFNIKVNYKRYRFIQIFATYAALIAGKNIEIVYRQLKKKMQWNEWICYGFFLSIISSMVPNKYRTYLSCQIQVVSDSHPSTPMPEVAGKFHTILDVFNIDTP
jgi:glycosyltransferase involved in cell wall biosynthesis